MLHAETLGPFVRWAHFKQELQEHLHLDEYGIEVGGEGWWAAVCNTPLCFHPLSRVVVTWMGWVETCHAKKCYNQDYIFKLVVPLPDGADILQQTHFIVQ